MKATVVTSAETFAAGTLSPRDFFDGPRVCFECGFAPQEKDDSKRSVGANPSVELLEPSTPDPRDPLRRSRMRCRNRAACEARKRMNRGRS